MSKISEYKSAITEYISVHDYSGLKEFLKSNSNLPGPRGNLEMAFAFGDCFDTETVTDGMWEFLLELSGIGVREAPVGDPSEILPFCAVLAAGSYYAQAGEERKAHVRVILRAAMNDGRWRMREAAAMGYQRMAEKDIEAVTMIFDAVYPGSNFLEKRAVIAALAHPPLLKDKSTALYSLAISEDIMNGICELTADELKSDEFKVLSKGLEYALSVFTAHAPEEGFYMLARFAAIPHKDIRRIIKSNLGKARLKDKFAEQADEVLSILNSR